MHLGAIAESMSKVSVAPQMLTLRILALTRNIDGHIEISSLMDIAVTKHPQDAIE